MAIHNRTQPGWILCVLRPSTVGQVVGFVSARESERHLSTTRRQGSKRETQRNRGRDGMAHEATKRTAASRKARRRRGRTKRIVETSFVNAPWSTPGAVWYGRRTRRMRTVSIGLVGEGIALHVGLDRSSVPLSRPFDAARGRAM